MAGTKGGYVALCYHYIRPSRQNDPFPRILGTRTEEFRRHIDLCSKHYQLMSPGETLEYAHGSRRPEGGKTGLLITFDDGLSDHFGAAEILADLGIAAYFFLPTCICKDNLPANPTIIHYCLAIYGIEGFLGAYRNALEECGLSLAEYDIAYERGRDDPWQTIARIKSTVKYALGYRQTRSVLLGVYENLLLADYPNAMSIMHLTKSQISEMVEMGHSIGVHSRSHISVAATELSDEDFAEEIIEPRRYLEDEFDMPVEAFSYPYGEARDSLPSEALLRRTADYKLAFTVEKVLNTKKSHPLELGRYMPMSTDDSGRLCKIIEMIIAGRGEAV